MLYVSDLLCFVCIPYSYETAVLVVRLPTQIELDCGGGVHNLIDTWKRIGVSGTCLIEAGVVDAHPKHPVVLWDDDRIGQPLGVVDLIDEASM